MTVFFVFDVRERVEYNKIVFYLDVDEFGLGTKVSYYSMGFPEKLI